MATPDDGGGLIKHLLEYAWAIVGVLMAIIWGKHKEEIVDLKAGQKAITDVIEKNRLHFDDRLDEFDHEKVSSSTFETNRKEVRDVQVKTFERLDQIGQSLARIEGKLEK